ncbi:MAG: hypothetical protein ACRETC_02000 [Gammaproteobacteria bacterium]
MATPTLDLDAWFDGLANDPQVFAHQLDVIDRRLLLVRLTPEQIRDAAFLDQRVLTGKELGVWVPLARALATRLPASSPRGLIVHCGHVGSTLIARLLGELPGAWVLREPLILHPLAAEARLSGTPLARLRAGEFASALSFSQAMLARTPAPDQAAIVKHTSFTANLAPLLLAGPQPPAVLCLWVALEDYLATLLRDPELRRGVRLAAGEWIHDLIAVMGESAPLLGALEDAELAALNWCAAQFVFAQARTQNTERVIGWRFDDFLAQPEERLTQLAVHLGLKASEGDIHRALSSPWLHRYAKDPRYPFDAETRAQELAVAKTRLAAEIRTGLSFARNLWRQLPVDNAFASPAKRDSA